MLLHPFVFVAKAEKNPLLDIIAGQQRALTYGELLEHYKRVDERTRHFNVYVSSLETSGHVKTVQEVMKMFYLEGKCVPLNGNTRLFYDREEQLRAWTCSDYRRRKAHPRAPKAASKKPHANEEIFLKAMDACDRHVSAHEVAECLGVSTTAVQAWYEKWNAIPTEYFDEPFLFKKGESDLLTFEALHVKMENRIMRRVSEEMLKEKLNYLVKMGRWEEEEVDGESRYRFRRSSKETTIPRLSSCPAL